MVPQQFVQLSHADPSNTNKNDSKGVLVKGEPSTAKKLPDCSSEGMVDPYGITVLSVEHDQLLLCSIDALGPTISYVLPTVIVLPYETRVSIT